MTDLILDNSFLLYLIIFITIMLEYANFPLPSEIVLPLAGAISIPFNLNVFLVLGISILGGIVGSLINYYLGYKYGHNLIDWVINKMPKSKKSFDVSCSFFEKHKSTSVLFSRLIPIARTMISIVAGTLKMNCFKFTIFSAIGISIWNTALILGGYIFFDNISVVTSILATYSNIIKVFILVVLLWNGFKYIKNKEKRKNKK